MNELLGTYNTEFNGRVSINNLQVFSSGELGSRHVRKRSFSFHASDDSEFLINGRIVIVGNIHFQGSSEERPPGHFEVVVASTGLRARNVDNQAPRWHLLINGVDRVIANPKIESPDGSTK